MAGVVLENLSTKKLTILIVTLLLLLIAFFLIGGLVAPAPYSSILSISVKCVDFDSSLEYGEKKPFIPRYNLSCDSLHSLNDKRVYDSGIEPNQIVFTQWLPLPRDNHQLEMSRWFQTMLTVIQVEIEHDPQNPYPTDKQPQVLLEATLYGRDSKDDETDWKVVASANVERHLDCKITETSAEKSYDCELLPFFELGSVYYQYYLINIRLPVNAKREVNNVGKIKDLHFITIFQNGGFTKVWFSLKTFFFPMTLLALVWFWHRVMQLNRPTNLLERTLFALGVILSIMNCPIEWITLVMDAPALLLINDIREGAFYAMLLSFWLIFSGEHMMDQIERNKLVSYWKHLTAVIVSCFALFIFEMCERGMQLRNPFYTIWASETGTKLALAFIILAGIAACGYFFFLCYSIFRVFKNIGTKSSSLQQMSNVRRKYYLGLIFRFKFLMVTTLLCAALTVIFFIISQVSEGQWKWGDDGVALEYSSAFLTGVYGMWNMYVFALLSLYAPSHKTTGVAEIYLPLPYSEAVSGEKDLLSFGEALAKASPQNVHLLVHAEDSTETLDGTQEEEMQLTQIPSDSSAVSAMISKSAMD